MAYETGVSTSPQDLVSKIYNHATANGWTGVRNNGAVTGASGAQHSLSDGSAAVSNQINMVGFNAANTAEIAMQPSTGDGGSGVQFFNHTGSPNTSGTRGTYVSMGHGTSTAALGFAGAHVAYHIFSGSHADGRYVHVVCEATAGVFYHMMFGTILKAGSFNGGQYATASNVRPQTSAQVMWPFSSGGLTGQGTQWLRGDGLYSFGTPGWQALHGAAHSPSNNSTVAAMTSTLYQGGLIGFNGRTPLGPVVAPFWQTVTPSGSSTLFYLLGHLPDVRLVNMDGREPGEQIVLGSDTWHLFPAYRKTTDGTSTTTAAFANTFVAGTDANTNDSNLAGYAFREIP